MKMMTMALVAAAQIALVILMSRAAIAITGDALSAVLLVLILTIALVSFFTRGAQPKRRRSCG